METLTELKYNYLYYVSYHIEHLLNDAHATLSREILEFALNELKCLEEISARTNWIGLQRLRTEIAEQAYKLVTKLVEVVAQSESSLVDVDELKQEIRSFVGWVKKMEEEYADLLYNPLPPQDDEEEDDEQDGIDVKMVGSSDQYDELKQKLLKATCQFSLPLFGMPGIGKTTLARKVFEDPDIVKHFEVRVWVTVGGKCRLNNIPRRIMARMNPDGLNKMFMERDVVLHLRGSLKGKRYLIVLDDVWEKYMVNNLQLWSHFGVNPLGDLLPHELNGSCVLLTSRPTQFEEAGKKIAENCEGLPLTIVTVADRLSKVMEVEYSTSAVMLSLYGCFPSKLQNTQIKTH